MGRLHGSDDVERGETREVGRRDDLRVLNAIATVARAVGFGDGFERIEGDGVGAIADSVEVELEAGLIALDRHLFQLGGIDGHDAACRWIVGIRRGHRGGARAESAIGNHFQCAGLEPRIGCAAFAAHVLQIFEVVGEVQPLGDANGELAFIFQRAIGEEVFPLGIVLDRGDAIFREVGEDKFDAATASGGAGFGSVLLDEADGGTFEQHTG